MDQASQQGIIYIDGSGPTYATPTVSEIWCFFYTFLSLSIFSDILF